MAPFRRNILAFLWMLVLVTTFTVPVASQSLPPKVLLDVPLVQQHNPEWCWLAATEMAIRFRRHGHSPAQCEMLEAGYRLPPGTCCGREMACTKAANGMAELSTVIRAFGGVITQWSPPGDPMALYNTLSQGYPVAAQIRTGMSSSHVVIIRGIKFEPLVIGMHRNGMPVYQLVPYLFVNDPLFSEPRIILYSDLRAIWMDSLIIGF